MAFVGYYSSALSTRSTARRAPVFSAAAVSTLRGFCEMRKVTNMRIPDVPHMNKVEQDVNSKIIKSARRCVKILEEYTDVIEDYEKVFVRLSDSLRNISASAFVLVVMLTGFYRQLLGEEVEEDDSMSLCDLFDTDEEAICKMHGTDPRDSRDWGAYGECWEWDPYCDNIHWP